jgi:DNA-binding SARP family transcriptional activator
MPVPVPRAFTVSSRHAVVRLITLGRLQLLRDGPPREPIHLQPKRLALLAFLALEAGDGYQQRDRLLALFWPRSDHAHARRCLRQALFHLRNQLGDGVILNRGRDGVALAPNRLWCDAVSLRQQLQRERRREALDLYGGDFLPGVFVDEAGAELEEWIERTRRQLRAKVVAATWELVEEESRLQPTTSAMELARRARSLSPDDEQGLRRHMTLLARAGDPAAALRVYAEFSRRLRQEYDAEPSSESQALARSLKQGRLLLEPSPALPERSDAARGSAPVLTTRRERASTGTRAKRLALLGLTLAAGVALAGPLTRTPSSTVDGQLVLAEFSNHTRDSLLGVAVTQTVRAELSKIAQVHLAGAPDMEPPYRSDPVQPGRALVLVTGDVTELGPGFTISARLVSADSGRLLALVQEDAANANSLLPTVKRLSQRLRGDVLESLASLAETSSLKWRIVGLPVQASHIDGRAPVGARRTP